MFGKRGKIKKLKSVDNPYGKEPRNIDISYTSDQSEDEREQRSPTPSCHSVSDFAIDPTLTAVLHVEKKAEILKIK